MFSIESRGVRASQIAPCICIAGLAVAQISCSDSLGSLWKKSDKSAAPAAVTDVKPGQCPLSTPSDWQGFVEDFASNEALVDTCELGGCDTVFAGEVYTKAQQVLTSCMDVIVQTPRLQTCTDHMRRFTPAFLAQHSTDSYGFTLDDKAYSLMEDGSAKPTGMMRVPDAFAAALPDQSKVVEVAKANGWKFLTHDSAISGTRTFVYIPDPRGRFDQWMLFNLDTSNTQTVDALSPLSFIAVQKQDAAGNTLPHVILNFRDYEISNGPLGYAFKQNTSGNGKCYSCHVSGVRQLIERRTKVLAAAPVKGEVGYGNTAAASADFAFGRLQEFNAILRNYGVNDWDGMINQGDFGPPLGTDQGCTTCHNGAARAVLTVATSTGQLDQKMYQELAMPPKTGLSQLLERHDMNNPGLSDAELANFTAEVSAHNDVFQSFMASRYPALKAWLLESSCQ